MTENLANDLEIERIKAWYAHRLEGNKAVIEFAAISIRGLILINGAAVAGILTFLGNLWTKDSPMAKATAQAVGPAMKYFVIGLGLAVLTGMLSYMSQALIFELPPPRPGVDPYIGTATRLSAIICAFVSLAVFAWGAIVAVDALGAPPFLG